MDGRVGQAFSLRQNLRKVFVPPAGHLRPLDGVRALSVLWVVVFHTAWYARFSLPPASWLRLTFSPWMLPAWRGDFGVDLFFVLSGFLIAGVLQDERSARGTVTLGRFYLRRLLRLWPALLVVAVADQWTADPNKSRAWASAVYLNDFVPVAFAALGWTWSLAIEEQFYLLCPWLLAAVAPLRNRTRAMVVGAVIATLVMVAACVVILADIRPWDAEIVGQANMLRWCFAFDVFYDKPWMRAGALLAGVGGALLYRERAVMAAIARGGGRVTGALVLAIASMLLVTHWPFVVGASRGAEVAYLATFRTAFGLLAAFVLLVTLSDHPAGRALARPLSSRLLFPFSQLAYSAYLVNPMVSLAVDRRIAPLVAHGEEPMRVYLPCDVLATFAAALVLHLAVERPGMELRPR